jgi:Zn-finger nucleic acid-binding protein
MGRVHCPRCSTALTAHQTASVLLHGCLACGGIFLDRDARARVVACVDASVAQASDLAAAHARWSPDTAAPIACPICRAGMRITRLGAGNVDIDVCDAHGAWFDRNELRRFLDALLAQRPNAKIEAKAAKLAKSSKPAPTPPKKEERHSDPPASGSAVGDAIDGAGAVFEVIGCIFEVIGAIAD